MEGRNFTGIGKIIIDMPFEKWNIPNLHFIVNKSGEKIYEAINLEFGLVAIGKSGKDAGESLANLAWTYVLAVIKDGNGYKELRETVRESFMSDYWAEFRGIEFDLAATGDDLSHDFNSRIKIAVQESFTDEFQEVLKRKADKTAEELAAHISVGYSGVNYKRASAHDAEQAEEVEVFLLYSPADKKKRGVA